MRRWAITTGKGVVYVTSAPDAFRAMTRFNKRFAGLEIASIVEVIEF